MAMDHKASILNCQAILTFLLLVKNIGRPKDCQHQQVKGCQWKKDVWIAWNSKAGGRELHPASFSVCELPSTAMLVLRKFKGGLYLCRGNSFMCAWGAWLLLQAVIPTCVTFSEVSAAAPRISSRLWVEDPILLSSWCSLIHVLQKGCTLNLARWVWYFHHIDSGSIPHTHRNWILH